MYSVAVTELVNTFPRVPRSSRNSCGRFSASGSKQKSATAACICVRAKQRQKILYWLLHWWSFRLRCRALQERIGSSSSPEVLGHCTCYYSCRDFSVSSRTGQWSPLEDPESLGRGAAGQPAHSKPSATLKRDRMLHFTCAIGRYRANTPRAALPYPVRKAF